MSAEFDEAVARVKARLAENPVDGSFKFDIADEGVILIRDGAVSTEDGEAEVVVRADLETFKEMFGGELSPTAAFMTGRVEIEGEMSKAMKLSALVE